MIIRCVNGERRGHYIVDGDGDSTYGPLPPKALPRGARDFWFRYGLGTTERAVVAYEGGVLVGFFRYTVTKTARWARYLIAGGTWVAAKMRRRRIALGMWERAIEKSRPQIVDVCTVSRGGEKLVKRLRTLHPTIRWEDC